MKSCELLEDLVVRLPRKGSTDKCKSSRDWVLSEFLQPGKDIPICCRFQTAAVRAGDDDESVGAWTDVGCVPAGGANAAWLLRSPRVRRCGLRAAQAARGDQHVAGAGL